MGEGDEETIGSGDNAIREASDSVTVELGERVDVDDDSDGLGSESDEFEVMLILFDEF
jgi:hypothetical protein